MAREEFVETFQRIVHKYDQFEKKKRYYGTDQLVSISEIHTIDAIGRSGSINVTFLAQTLGVTKGSASQMVYKLVDKGFVEKQVSPISDREVVLTLSQKGRYAYEKHQEGHKRSKGKLTQFLLDMPEDVYQLSENYFAKFESIMDEMLEEEDE